MNTPTHTVVENVLVYGKMTRRAFLMHYIFIIVLFLLGLYSARNQAKMPVMSTFAIVFFAIAIFLLAYSEIRIRMRRLIVTNKRLILQSGILRKDETTIKYPTITEIRAQQGVLERILKYGTISINTSGEKKQDLMITKIKNPFRVKKTIEHYVNLHHPHPAHHGHVTH